MHFFAFLKFAILVCYVTAQAEECPALFLRYASDHSYCKPANPTCNILRSFATENDINVILREHNNYRSNIASGKVSNLPPAENMMQMVWDPEMASVAQKHANQCLFEHDCSNCRRVQNFGVGQNLAIQEITNSPDIPEPNWPLAIKTWYDEIEFFPINAVNEFLAPAPPPAQTFGHFSQLVWAESWRIGCGYVVYQNGNKYTLFYVCNYGPTGNIVSESTYKKGQPCSDCPVNSCCNERCIVNADYSGLCKITDNRGPIYESQDPHIFYCDFQNQPDCKSNATGQNNWLLYNTLSGSFLGIILNGGEESTMVFNKKIKPLQSATFCFTINYRKGPNIDGQEDANTATGIFKGENFEVTQSIPNFENLRHQFNRFTMSLGWNMETEFQLTFSVPSGKPAQFFEIESIYATEGNC